MSRTAKPLSDLASDSSRTPAVSPSRRNIGERLAHIRASNSQKDWAEGMGIPLRTYQNYERGEREPDLRLLASMWGRGWNVNWVLFGDGPERLKAAFQSHSQDLSEENLNIALEYTDDIIRATRTTYVPRSLFAKLLRLMYQGVTQGLPVAEIHEIGQQFVRAVISGTGEQSDGGQSGLGGTGTGGR